MIATCVWLLGCELGEGPVFDLRDGALWFVDIAGRRLHRLSADGRRHGWNAPGKPGFALPAQGGGVVVGIGLALHRFTPEAGFTHLADIPGAAGARANDACAGPDGLLWLCTMDDAGRQPLGELLSWDGSAFTVHDRGYVVANGPAFSPDGATFYHTDTVAGLVQAYDHAGGVLANRRDLIRFDPPHGHPDGTTVDTEGTLWVGLWDGAALARFSPEGAPIGRVALPCDRVTKAAIGPARAYVTTARDGLDAAALARQPLAGGLFAFDPPAPGLPTPLVAV